MGVRTNLVQEEALGLPCLTKVSAVNVVEDVSIYPSILAGQSGSILHLSCVCADTASAVCPSQSGCGGIILGLGAKVLSGSTQGIYPRH